MIVQGQCTVFKYNVLNDYFASVSGTFSIALYTANADLNANTLEYTTLEEVVGDGYTAGGLPLTVNTIASSGSTAYVSFDNAIWLASSFLCRGALIYNSTSNAAVAVLDFGSDKTASGTFTVTFPPSTATTAVIRTS